MLISLQVFGKVMQYHVKCQNVCDLTPKHFQATLKRVMHLHSIILVMSNTPFDNVGQTESTHGVLQSTSIWVLLSI